MDADELLDLNLYNYHNYYNRYRIQTGLYLCEASAVK